MDKHSIEDVLRHYGASIPFNKNGWVKMKCCFHDDTHASATVNFTDNAFKCFACDVQGDVYDIIMEREGLSFVKAVKFAEGISSKSGANVRSGSSSGSRLSSKSRTNIGRRSAILDRDGK